MSNDRRISFELDEDTWQRLEQLAAQFGQQPGEWAERFVRLRLGRPLPEDMTGLAEQVRRLEAPVRSWPEMERSIMQACLGMNSFS